MNNNKAWNAFLFNFYINHKEKHDLSYTWNFKELYMVHE